MPHVQFRDRVVQPTTDQHRPLDVSLVNKSYAADDFVVRVAKGDAVLVPDDQLPAELTVYGLQSWVRRARLVSQMEVHLDSHEQRRIAVLPGSSDSIIVVLKNKQAFGNMTGLTNEELTDLNGNMVVAACRVLKRLDPQKPYVYLSTEPSHKYIILSPCSRNMPELVIRTRPYCPVQVGFTIVNPASQQFNCEVQTGRDLIAPSIIKLGPQQRADASFAVNPDRAGDMETFITFHDCNMRIVVVANGPDLTLRCAAIRGFNALIKHQGMVLNEKLVGRQFAQKYTEAQKQGNDETLQWERLLETIPQGVAVKDLSSSDLEVGED